MKNLSLVIIIFVFALSAFGQAFLTNNDVIEMVKNGLSPTVIVAKINSSDAKFDTSTSGLLALSVAKVPDPIVVAMLDKEQHRSEQAKSSTKESSQIINSIPEQGTLSDITGKRRIYIITRDLKARDIIAKELVKNSQFQIADKAEVADLFIQYTEETVNVSTSAVVSGNTGTIRDNNKQVGELTVFMTAENGNRKRQLYTARKSKFYLWEENPAKTTVRQFLSDLEKR